MKRLTLVLCFLFCSIALSAQVSITGNLGDIATNNVSSNAWVRFQLIGCGPNTPRVIGTNVLIRSQYDFRPNATGVVSGTLYGNDQIDCGGVQSTQYLVTQYLNNTPIPPAQKFRICQVFVANSCANNGTFNLNSALPTVQNPQPITPSALITQSFQLSQTTPATTWTINHNFNDANVLVQFYDASGNELFPATVQRTSPNQIVATFSTPQTGTATAMHAANPTIAQGSNLALVVELFPTGPQHIVGNFGFTIDGAVNTGNGITDTSVFGFNGKVGATTPNAGAFTNLTSTGGALNGSIGATTPSTGAFTTLSATSVSATTLSATGQITSTLATGTSPFSIASTTVVPNLNSSFLLGNTWAAPGPIGGTTPSTALFTKVGSNLVFADQAVGASNAARVQAACTALGVSVEDFGAVGNGSDPTTLPAQCVVESHTAFLGDRFHMYTADSGGTVRQALLFEKDPGGENPMGAMQIYGELATIGSQSFNWRAGVTTDTTLPPLGNDLFLDVYGPADLHLRTTQMDNTATTTVTAGSAQTITMTGSTATYYTAAPLFLEPGSAKQELLNPGTCGSLTAGQWCIVDSTHLSIFPNQSHTANWLTRQIGSIGIESPIMSCHGDQSNTAFASTSSTMPFCILDDGFSNPIITFPANAGSAFPTSAIQINAAVTGTNSGHDLLLRNFSSAGVFRWVNAADTVFIMTLDDGGNLIISGGFSIGGSVNAGSYKVGGVAGFSGTKGGSACVFAVTNGIITNITGC